MAAAAVNRLRAALQKFENAISYLFGNHYQPGHYAVASIGLCEPQPTTKSSFNLNEIFDGFLFAVPKSRRTVEKRLNRKFGHPDYVWKPHVPKTNILVCNTCGHHHEAGVLCGKCYERINNETKEMQAAIEKNLGLEPVEKEVIVLYAGEKKEQSEEFWKGKRIIELEKPRPQWFSKNLLQKSTIEPATSTDVKPTELA